MAWINGGRSGVLTVYFKDGMARSIDRKESVAAPSGREAS